MFYLNVEFQNSLFNVIFKVLYCQDCCNVWKVSKIGGKIQKSEKVIKKGIIKKKLGEFRKFELIMFLFREFVITKSKILLMLIS